MTKTKNDVKTRTIHGLPTELPTVSILENSGLPLSCQVGSLICMAQCPRAVHEQPTPLPTELPPFLIFESSWLPTELPSVSIYGSSRSLIYMAKFPWATHSAAKYFFFQRTSSWLHTEPPAELSNVFFK